MIKFFCINIIISLIIVAGCSKGNLMLLSKKLGSDLSNEGIITDNSLEFKFKAFHKKGKVKDLFNYLYFEGDALCFSFKFNKNVQGSDIKVWFIDSVKNNAFPAERIDINKDVVHGFSLVGSIMESFLKENLNKKIPPAKYCCEDIRFSVKIEINKDSDSIVFKEENSFKILYQ